MGGALSQFANSITPLTEFASNLRNREQRAVVLLRVELFLFKE